ncbi:type II toxin-antitoxin system HicA family toxin [Novosphingobium sp. ZW T3_23]|uniref:type II toxin-antitoxin system HicA family toxin n=1 Tax=Novosphingobium sp. ZW T3_23 TaxID=3378084 RepID=UPI003851A831
MTTKKFRKLIELFGFEHISTKGSHQIWKHPRLPHPLPIQIDAPSIKKYQVTQILELADDHNLYLS